MNINTKMDMHELNHNLHIASVKLCDPFSEILKIICFKFWASGKDSTRTNFVINFEK
ncbi:hypothetical protein Hanom_Chr12g01068561 [Helianthus anomalus]